MVTEGHAIFRMILHRCAASLLYIIPNFVSLVLSEVFQ